MSARVTTARVWKVKKYEVGRNEWTKRGKRGTVRKGSKAIT